MNIKRLIQKCINLLNIEMNTKIGLFGLLILKILIESDFKL